MPITAISGSRDDARPLFARRSQGATAEGHGAPEERGHPPPGEPTCDIARMLNVSHSTILRLEV